MADSPLLTKKEAAQFCRCSLAAFDAHVRAQLPCKKIGRRVLFHRADLEAWAQAEAAPKPAPKSLGAPSLRPQRWTGGGPLLQQLQAAPGFQASVEELRATVARRAAKRALREAKEGGASHA